MDKKKIQYTLCNYKYYKDEIYSCKEQLLELEELDGVGAVRFDTVSAPGNGSKVERCVLLREKRRDILNYRIERLTVRLSKIDRILDTLPPLHAQVLKYRYIEDMSDIETRKYLSIPAREYRTVHDMALIWFGRDYDYAGGLARDEDEEEQEQNLERELKQLIV